MNGQMNMSARLILLLVITAQTHHRLTQIGQLLIRIGKKKARFVCLPQISPNIDKMLILNHNIANNEQRRVITITLSPSFLIQKQGRRLCNNSSNDDGNFITLTLLLGINYTQQMLQYNRNHKD